MEARKTTGGTTGGTDTTLRNRLRAAQREGITFAMVSTHTGVSRSLVSQYANNGYPLRSEYVKAIGEYLDSLDRRDDAEGEAEAAPAYKTTVELYETEEYNEAMGFARYVTNNRKMGVVIGHPGSGKTTILKEFAKTEPGAHYIECWPSMRMGDLLATLGRVAGITPCGNNYAKVQQIIAALQDRTDVVLLLDEAEYLKKWDVDKFELLRKVWDNTGTPVIFAGTPVLETILTRGGGKDNLAQLYRRKYEIKLEGIKKAEVAQILRGYNMTPDASAMLIQIATDVRHGGMGNFVELLGMCLAAADGEAITAQIVTSARKYKLLY